MQSVHWENHPMPTDVISLCAKPWPFQKVFSAIKCGSAELLFNKETFINIDFVHFSWSAIESAFVGT